MAADVLAVRMAHLEGAYEQVDKRLGAIETRLTSLETQVDRRVGSLEATVNGRFGDLDRKFDLQIARVDAKFTQLLYGLFLAWVTVILAILFHR